MKSGGKLAEPAPDLYMPDIRAVSTLDMQGKASLQGVSRPWLLSVDHAHPRHFDNM